MSEYIVKCNEVVGISGKTLIVPDYIDTSKEIVRCRDCKYRYRCLHLVDDGDDDMRLCNATPDGFCAWGELRGEGDTK